jgi:hypothetical protein
MSVSNRTPLQPAMIVPRISWSLNMLGSSCGLEDSFPRAGCLSFLTVAHLSTSGDDGQADERGSPSAPPHPTRLRTEQVPGPRDPSFLLPMWAVEISREQGFDFVTTPPSLHEPWYQPMPSCIDRSPASSGWLAAIMNEQTCPLRSFQRLTMAFVGLVERVRKIVPGASSPLSPRW